MTTHTPSRPKPTSRKKRANPLMTVLGLILVIAGVSILGWGAWQYWGTNIFSKQEQSQAKDQIVDDWDKGLDPDAIGLVRIERFGKDYEMPVLKGFGEDALSRGVGTYTKGAKPGEVGNFVMAGHRVTNGEPFRDFLKLRKGDLVEVETRTNIYTYKLKNSGESITVDFTVSWPLQAVPDPDARPTQRPTKQTLTLLTCSELFHTRDRQVVLADLVKDRKKPAESSN